MTKIRILRLEHDTEERNKLSYPTTHNHFPATVVKMIYLHFYPRKFVERKLKRIIART